MPVGDRRQTTGAVLQLLRDEERRRAYGERNRRFVRETVGDPGPELDRLYRELVAS